MLMQGSGLNPGMIGFVIIAGLLLFRYRMMQLAMARGSRQMRQSSPSMRITAGVLSSDLFIKTQAISPEGFLQAVTSSFSVYFVCAMRTAPSPSSRMFQS